ncbi:MAG: cation diffusion facilitator family transporter, partial [Firmicutes bacterium]|nr:cation diffusion facilitator family transporter [Bacillota bacterium]
ADAWHHRSDAFSSIGSLIGIAGARMGYPVLDSIACVGICLCILKVGFDILKDALDKLLDSSCGSEFDKELSEFIASQPGVAMLDSLQSRKFGEMTYIDVEIAVDETLSLKEAHQIAENVHDAVEGKYPKIKHIMIHENPHPCAQPAAE